MAGSIRFLLALGAVGGEATGELAQAIWNRFSRSARLAEAYRRLRLAGHIEVHGTGPIDTRIVRLTADGRRASTAGIDPVQQWDRPWDGIWRIVAFDIPETAANLRVRLRRKLHAHRFGWLQNSVWISPDPIAEFHSHVNETPLLPESLTVLKAQPSGGESSEAIVASAWDFEALAKAQKHYLEVLNLRPTRLSRDGAWANWLTTEQRAWGRVAKLDPFLPRVLHPSTYRGEAIWKARTEAYAALGRSFA